MAYSPGRSGKAWLKVQAQVYGEETHCWWCRRYVNQTLPRTHPMGRTVDHVVELWQGGDPLDRANCRLAHRKCNSEKSQARRSKGRPPAGFSVDAGQL
jgi:5-methylcytosine-specific restriction endonuclease McrA